MRFGSWKAAPTCGVSSPPLGSRTPALVGAARPTGPSAVGDGRQGAWGALRMRQPGGHLGRGPRWRHQQVERSLVARKGMTGESRVQ